MYSATNKMEQEMDKVVKQLYTYTDNNSDKVQRSNLKRNTHTQQSESKLKVIAVHNKTKRVEIKNCRESAWKKGRKITYCKHGEKTEHLPLGTLHCTVC